MFSAHDIAIAVINWCSCYGVDITNLKLQKLLYFLQGEYVRETNSRLIKDDFYAWQLGPVVPSVYSEYAIYSSSTIPAIKDADNIIVTEDQAMIIDRILKKYARISTWNLVELSHKQDPWKYNFQIFGDKAIIPFESIERYFKRGRA